MAEEESLPEGIELAFEIPTTPKPKVVTATTHRILPPALPKAAAQIARLASSDWLGDECLEFADFGRKSKAGATELRRQQALERKRKLLAAKKLALAAKRLKLEKAKSASEEKRRKEKVYTS